MLALLRRFKTIGLVSVLAAVGHLLGFGREVATAYYFGASSISDGILVGLIPLTLYASIFGTAYANAAIVRIRDPYNEELIRNSLLPLVLLGAACAMAFLVGAEPLVATMAPGLAGEGRKVAIAFVQLSSVGAALVSMSFWGRGLLHLEQRFARATFSDLMPNLGAILGIALLYWWLGIYGLAIGGVLGYFAQFLAVTRWQHFRLGKAQVAALWSPEQRAIYKNATLASVSYSVVYADVLVGRYFASQLSEGSIAIMNFGQKLMLLPLYTVIFALSTVAFPKLIAARSDPKVFSSLKRATYLQTLAITGAVSVVAIFLAEPIVRIAFNYGSFDAEAVKDTVSVFRIYLIGLIGHSFVLVASRVHYALENFKAPLIAGLVATIVNVVLSYTLVKRFEVEGLAFATSAGAITNALMLTCVRVRQ